MSIIDSILAPVSRDSFFVDAWGKKSFHIHGDSKKFDGIIDWTDVNGLLNNHRLEYPRLRIAHRGSSREEQTSQFIRQQPLRRGGTVPRLDVGKLYRHLQDGATLIVDAVDEAIPTVRRVSEELELFFRERIQVNLYAGWGKDNGFDVHWDDHDVLVLQILGSKEWRLFGQTRKAPLFRDAQIDTTPPTQPIWEDTLTAGDVLYIPRGEWHVAYPIGEPTLHLTFGITNRTGIDFLGWLVDQARTIEICRKDLPRFAGHAELAQWSRMLWDAFISTWTDDKITAYFEEYDTESRSRPDVSLPWAVGPQGFTSQDRVSIKLRASRSLEVKPTSEMDEIAVVIDGQRLILDARLSPLIDSLRANPHGLALQSLLSLSTGVGRAEMLSLLNELLRLGLLAIVTSE